MVTFLFHPSYNLFLSIAAMLLMLLSFGIIQPLEIEMHDQYYVIPRREVIMLLASAFAIIWVIYKFTNQILWSTYMTQCHIGISLLVFTVVMLLLFSTSNNIQYLVEVLFRGKDMMANTIILRITQTSEVLIYIFIFGQLVFLVNVLVGFAKYISNSK
jgi:hypothetical protein